MVLSVNLKSLLEPMTSFWGIFDVKHGLKFWSADWLVVPPPVCDSPFGCSLGHFQANFRLV